MATTTFPKARPGSGGDRSAPCRPDRNRATHGGRLDPRAHIAAFAEATEAYAESLEDPDLANVYWGKSLGLWQALAILAAEDHPARSAASVATPAALRSEGR